LNSISNNLDFGSSDLYLIKKLKESGINVEKINLYIQRLKYQSNEKNTDDLKLTVPSIDQ